MSRAEAAVMGGMDRQTLRDWVHRFNAAGPDGLLDNWASGPVPRLSAAQTEFARIVEIGPDREVDGVVRWRRIDLKRVIADGSASIVASAASERFSENSASRTSPRGRAIRPRMPRQLQLIKKLCPHAERSSA